MATGPTATGPTARIRVALVNDYEVVVRGLASMLRSYEHLIDVVELDVNRDVGQPVDIALWDNFASPEMGSAQMRRLVENPNVARVVVYSWVLDPDVAQVALDNGVAAYLSKELPAAQLVEALVAVNRGEDVGRPTPRREPAGVIGGDWPGREEGITQRESEVLALIVQGLSNAEIAERTYLSINSVKTYIRSCYRRIGASNRTQAVLWAVDHGFRSDRGPATD